MISILYPEIIQHIQDLHFGLMTLRKSNENKPFLIIKATKECILSAKINNEFKLYLIDDYEQKGHHLGLTSAFFDYHDEPLRIATPIFSDDDMLMEIRKLFEYEEFEIYFFDEHNRELLSVHAINENVERYRQDINQANFSPINLPEALNIQKKMDRRFAVRDTNDDARAYTIQLGERIYPDDLMITDLRENFSGYNEDKKSIAETSLERDRNPGDMQERDIALMMRRLFDPHNLYVNPYRLDTGKELTDILVVGDEEIILIQAKDSPNTEKMLNRSIDRKRKTIRAHIEKATNQLRGAITYGQNNKGLTIKTATNSLSIIIGDKQLMGIVVVKELFDDDYAECSKPMMKLMSDLEFPALLTDYQQLHVLTQSCECADHFFDVILNIVQTALKKGEYPKIVNSGKTHPPQAT